MKVCNFCSYFRLINTKALTGKCGAEPKEEIVSMSRPACRFFKDKHNFVEDPEDDILIESRGREL